MRIGFIIIAVYVVATLFLITRIDRPSKKSQRLTGRGGDFE